jgi:hypothetical protein
VHIFSHFNLLRDLSVTGGSPLCPRLPWHSILTVSELLGHARHVYNPWSEKMQLGAHSYRCALGQGQLQGLKVKQVVKTLFALQDEAIDKAAEHIIVQVSPCIQMQPGG